MAGKKRAASASNKPDIDKIAGMLKGGEIGLHHIDRMFEPALAASVRRQALSRISGVDLQAIGSAALDYERVLNRNAENVIGSVQVPLGVAGPIRVSGTYANGSFYLPLATTEGALIASINRGAKAITRSGGATARVFRDKMSRAPVFRLGGIREAKAFIEWVEANFHKIKVATDGTTSHGRLTGIRPFILGNNVWLRFSFETGDAMGMNMATIATEAACDFIEHGFPGARLVAVSGNMCSDKKSAQINNILGRGKTVAAEAVIDRKTLNDIFGTTAEAVHDTNMRKNWLGSARAGSMQFNAHFSNIIASMFLATGQDAAQVIESSNGYTWTENRNGDLYISVTLPSLEVGTVGGGTGLPAQTEALALMGVAGGAKKAGDNAKKLSEIIASAVLAGELNLIAALSSRELGRAHKALGRNKSDAD